MVIQMTNARIKIQISVDKLNIIERLSTNFSFVVHPCAWSIAI